MMWFCMWKSNISKEKLIRFLDHFNIFCEQLWKKSNFGSPFTSKKVPFWSPFRSKLGPLWVWVPFLQFLGSLKIWEQWKRNFMGKKSWYRRRKLGHKGMMGNPVLNRDNSFCVIVSIYVIAQKDCTSGTRVICKLASSARVWSSVVPHSS